MIVAKHPKDVLHQEIARVDAELERPVKVYLIGGGAMSFQGLKDATKDIDGILENEPDLHALAAALERAGYTASTDLDAEYMNLSTTRVYAKAEAPQWDLFIQVVCKKLRLSPGMKARSTRFQYSGEKLELRLIAPGDIFVFKSITERKGDVPDVDTLWASGLDWDAILDEMEWQCAHSDHAWAGLFFDTLQRLQGEGRRVPILSQIGDLVDLELDEWAVMSVLDQPQTADQVLATLQRQETADVTRPVQAAIKRLVDRGRLLDEGVLRANPAWSRDAA